MSFQVRKKEKGKHTWNRGLGADLLSLGTTTLSAKVPFALSCLFGGC